MAPSQASSGWEVIGRKGHWQPLPIEPHSDGEQRQWPAQPYRPSSEERYFITLAKAWAEKLAIQQPGKMRPNVRDKRPTSPASFVLYEMRVTLVLTGFQALSTILTSCPMATAFSRRRHPTEPRPTNACLATSPAGTTTQACVFSHTSFG